MVDLSWHSAAKDFNIWLALLFLAAFAVVDAIFALYTMAVTRNDAARAANLSFIYYLVGAAGILGYVHDFLYIVPAAIGSWLGTYVSIKKSKTSK